ncbi:MAG: MFS transporter, partial [Vallitaleaceae bacterium]|nr:MFS transporter [Vallitaleaceae bacterium]
IMFFLKIPPHKKAAEKQSGGYFDDLKEGFKYVKQNEFIIDLLVFYAIFFFLLVPVMFLTPLLVTRSFGSEVWKLTMNEIVFFVGSALGGIIVSIWGGFKNKAYTIFISCIVFGVLTVALGLSTLFWIYLAFMLVMGLVVPFFSTAVTVLLQEKVEQDMQGRVFGLIQMVTTAVMPLGMLLFGPMADVVTVEVLLIVTGAFVLILGVRIAFHKRLRSLG